jgi:hypothetical protein
MRISVFVIEVVRTLDELYNVRCSVRTVLVRSRNTTPTPDVILTVLTGSITVTDDITGAV